MNETHDTLLQRAQAFDRKALADVYETYQPLIYSYIFRRVGDVENARDLTADVFKHFLQGLQRGQGPEQSLRAWLYRAAHNLVVDHYRRQQFRQHLPLEENDFAGIDEPAQMIEQSLLVGAVRQILHTLTPDQQEVIALKFLEGWSNEEIAVQMNKPIGAVKSLQHRGLMALQRGLTAQQTKVLP